MCITLASLILAVCDLSGAFADRSGWETPAEDFVTAHAEDGFRFASDKHDIVNCLRKGGATWNGLEVWETRVYYKAGVAERVERSLYNRGDDKGGGLGAEELKALLDRAAAAAEPGGRIGVNPEKRKLKSGGWQFVRRFTGGGDEVSLAWGVSSLKQKEQTADFVRVTLTPKGAGRPTQRQTAGIVSAAKTKANVVKEASGDVWIDNVPMVDQGQKGYCAAAVAERVLRYYGKTVDEHEIAQMAGSTAEGGTSLSEMAGTVRDVGSKNRLGFAEIVSFSSDMKGIERDVDAYNKAARALKEPAISLDSCKEGNCFMLNRLYEQMKPEVVLKARTKDARFKKFLSGVKAQVDRGIPVFWGVTLGRFPEPEIPQTAGGHMRLIIGYNTKKHTIIYTDTWGAGHERKEMDEGRAFAITHDAFFLKPL